MPETPATRPRSLIPRKIIQASFNLIFPEIPAILKYVTQFLQRGQGLYEVFEYESCLELLDTIGKKAVYTKYQRVRFLQNNVIAYQDLAWGDGDIFADYQCSPGKAVDHYREGHRHWTLISLRETKQRGDMEDFHITRTIHDGFRHQTEEWQTEINHLMHHLKISLIFPRQRPPKNVTLIEQNTTRTITLGPQHTKSLPDGRIRVTWHTRNPRMFEAYILRWQW